MKRLRSMAGRLAGLSVACLALIGCVATTRTARLAGLPESVCRHCNCLMPAGSDPQAKCSVCDCGKQNYVCIRGK